MNKRMFTRIPLGESTPSGLDGVLQVCPREAQVCSPPWPAPGPRILLSLPAPHNANLIPRVYCVSAHALWSLVLSKTVSQTFPQPTTDLLPLGAGCLTLTENARCTVTIHFLGLLLKSTTILVASHTGIYPLSILGPAGSPCPQRP